METNLRNQFAMAAITGLANTFIEADDLATRAWDIADAMIRKLPAKKSTVVTSGFAIPIPENVKEPEAIKKLEKVNGAHAKYEPARRLNFKNNKALIQSLLDTKGKTTNQLLDEFNERSGNAIKYSGFIYLISEMEKKGIAKVDKRNKPYIWKATKASLPAPETDNQEDNQPDEHDELEGRKLQFIEHLGYDSISQAVLAEGPF